MREFTVTYNLTSNQIERLRKLSEHVNRPMEEQFNFMMNIGSVEYINNKLTAFENLNNHNKENEQGRKEVLNYETNIKL